MKSIWRNFFTGFFVLLPAILTFLILRLMFGWFVRLTIPIARIITPYITSWWAVLLSELLVLVGFIVFVALVGWATRLLVFRKIFGLLEKRFSRLPMIGKIYSTTKEILSTFSGDKRGLFSRVVLLEWPRIGMYSIGFVTSEGKGEVQEKTLKHVVNVFVPTTPTPTSGFLVFVPRESVIEMNMSIEEGMKLVISGGVVGPEVVVPGPRSG